ncbi:SgcJ/EcaC family oxidoreductase [Microbacterium sp. LTA6]|uniref:SgcJ/EcaC family oxidoreductase n=1 Tax=Microbacterium sp. LTA6 TaxID=3129771 RepID=UPI0032558E9C
MRDNALTRSMTTNDAQEIDAFLAEMRDAWASGDADRYASMFTEDAVYVIFVGIASLGRKAIARDHEPVLTKWQRGSQMSMRVLDRRLIAHDVAVVLTEGGIGTRARIPHDKMQTFTLVRTADGWRCAAFQNTKKNRLFIRMNERAMHRSRSAA